MIERFRWWHVAQVLPIEKDLFGAEQWSAAMFWNELAQRHYYLVALAVKVPTTFYLLVAGRAWLAWLNSEWRMPLPALMRCTSPGRITLPLPMLSLWPSSPSST